MCTKDDLFIIVFIKVIQTIQFYHIVTSKPMSKKDIDLYKRLLSQESKKPIGGTIETEHPDSIQPPYAADALFGFILHAVLKALLIVMFLFRGIFTNMFNALVINELIAVVAVIDFWFTKNVNGKKLLGLRWFFDEDEYGTQKFMFQCRANDELIGFVWSKLFWVVQITYTLLPFVMIIMGIVQAPFLLVNIQMILVSLGLLLAGGINLFFFLQANSAAVLKQKEIKRKLGVELIKDLRYATITSFS